MNIDEPTAVIVIVVLLFVMFAVSDHRMKRDDARRVKSGELSDR